MKVNLAETMVTCDLFWALMTSWKRLSLRELLKSPFFIAYVCISSAGWAYAYSFSERLTLLYLVSNAVTASLLICLPGQVKLISTSVLTRCTFFTC